MREDVLHHQPSVMGARRHIQTLIERGDIQIVACEVQANDSLAKMIGPERSARVRAAQKAGGYALEFLPLTHVQLDAPPPDIPSEIQSALVNCRAVVEALHQDGPLAGERYASVLESLGIEGTNAAGTVVPQQHVDLFCGLHTLELLARVDVLDLIARRFHIRLDHREADELRWSLRWNERNNETVEWLNSLLQRISKGLDQGSFTLIPEPSGTPDTGADGPDERDPTFGCLRALLKYEPQQGDAIWVDDRRVNCFPMHSNGVIIGTNEVLQALVGAGELDQSAYYHYLHVIRAANLRFVPFDQGEILYQLGQASIRNDEVVETEALEVIRRSMAACLLDGTFQRPPDQQDGSNPLGEMLFTARLVRAVGGALAGVWAGTTDDMVAQARSGWILKCLYLDQYDILSVAGLRGPQHESRFMAAASLRALIANGITLTERASGAGPTARQRYLAWLEKDVLEPRFDADPDLVASTAALLKSTLAGFAEEQYPGVPTWAAKAYLARLIDDLPGPIRDEIMRDADFTARLGARYTTAVTLAGVSFDPDELWNAAAEAINGRPGATTVLETKERVEFTRIEENGKPGVSFRHPVAGKTVRFVGEELALLSDTVHVREDVLRRHREWFDCPAALFEQVVAEIASAESPRVRIDAAGRWRATSAAVFYAQLRQAGRSLQRLVPPSAEALLRHYRLPAEFEPGEFTKLLADASAQLVAEEGLAEAIERLAGLPVPLPEEIVRAAAELPHDGKLDLVKRLMKAPGSPISRMHFAHLVLRLADGDRRCTLVARRTLARVLSTNGLAECDAFIGILRWTEAAFGLWSETSNWSASVRLGMAWAHAHRLYGLLTTAGYGPADLASMFDRDHSYFSRDLFGRDREYRLDVAHAHRATSVVVLLAGAYYAARGRGEALVSQASRDVMQERANAGTERGQSELLALLWDATRAPNALDSFLGGDRAEMASALGFGEVSAIRPAALRSALESAITTIREAGTPDASQNAWRVLLTILDGAPPPDDLVAQLLAGLRATDYAGFFERDANTGRIAIHAAALQAINVADEPLRRYLCDQLVALAGGQTIRERGGIPDDGSALSPEQQAIGATLLDAALHIAISARRPREETVSEFVTLVSRLIDEGSWIALLARPFVQRLYDNMPIAEARALAPLLVRLRAE